MFCYDTCNKIVKINSEAKKGFFSEKIEPKVFFYILKVKTKRKYFSLHHEDRNKTNANVLER